MSLIGNCLARLVKAGKISQKVADAALALDEGMQGRLGQSIPLTHSEAAAALESARAIAAAARQRKLGIAKNAIREAELEGRIAAHPNGDSAGLVAALQFDPFQAKTPGFSKVNVESHSEGVLGNLFAHVSKLLEPYGSKLVGLRQDLVGIRNVVRELYGIDTGDAVAKAAAAGWKGGVDAGVARARLAGKEFNVLEDWRLPQFWERSRVKKFEVDRIGRDGQVVPGIRTDILNDVRAGKIRLIDKDTGQPATALKAPMIVDQAVKDIIEGGNLGVARAFRKDMRVFHFVDPETWLKYADKYGAGSGGVYSMMVGHLKAMSREIALTEIFGPNHGAIFGRLLKKVRQAGPARRGGVVARTITGARAAELAYKDLTGQLGAPVSDTLAGIFGALRNIKTTLLGSAIVSAIPGDIVTAIWTSRVNGIPAMQVLRRAVDLLAADDVTKRELAAQMNLVAHAVQDATLGAKRFEDGLIGPNISARIASTVIRATGLQAWTEALKRAFSMEFLGLIARQSDFEWDGLDEAFRGFLQRYGFTPDDWSQIRKTTPIDAEGARFFDADAAGPLGNRLMSAVVDERHYAVLEPTAIARGITSMGQRRGTWAGEIARSSFMFKSFALTMMMTHAMRTASEGPIHMRAFRFAGFVATMSIAGAAALQAKQILAGKDPRPMNTTDFLWAALAQGGGLGLFGDFAYSGVNRGGQGVTSSILGPLLGEIGGTWDFLKTLIDPAETGRQRGEALAQYLKRWTPGASQWYSRTATDRWVFDFIQRMIDGPDADAAFRRSARTMRQDYGQEYFWPPGQGLPERGPNLGAALPN